MIYRNPKNTNSVMLNRRIYNVDLSTIDKIQAWLGKVSKTKADLSIKTDNAIINAKSLMGLLSLDLSVPHELEFSMETNDMKFFNEEASKFERDYENYLK